MTIPYISYYRNVIYLAQLSTAAYVIYMKLWKSQQSSYYLKFDILCVKQDIASFTTKTRVHRLTPLRFPVQRETQPNY